MRTPTTPYGALIETRLRVVSWNLWWRLGEWRARAEAIAQTLEKLRPDLVCLQEVWQQGGDNQAASLAHRLGMEYTFSPDRTEGDLDRGVALLSRWPLSGTQCRALPVPSGIDERTVALAAVVEGPRGPILLVTTHLLPFPPRGEFREQQVRALVALIAERGRQPPLIVLCGDFNAVPDSDEVRLLTGRRVPAVQGWTFLDAWETAGDGSPGFTLAKANPNAAPLLLPNLRWDYIFVNWPSLAGGGGHPVHAEIAGAEAVNGVVPSDHYAVLADLRY
jgi:endonuclease/exonuclease/phosphatase family metal-dependent hydrolase